MKRMMQSTVRRNFTASSAGRQSHITEGHKAVFMALTAGEPNFCLTSIFLNGQPAVAIVLVGQDGPDTITMAPCFVSITNGMTLRDLDGHEYRTGV